MPSDTTGESPRRGEAPNDDAGGLYDRALRLAQMGAWECDLATEELTWTEGVYDLFDLAVGTRIKRAAIVDLYCDESRAEMEVLRAEAIRTGQNLSMDAQIRTSRGELRWMRLSIGVTREDGRSIRLFGAKQNVTAERNAWARLREMAERDALTGLANRGLFEAHYQNVVADTIHHAGVAAVVLIDIDHFKQINDAFGHLAGDECLRRVAMRLQRIFGDAMLVARIGGDEFGILLRAPLGEERIRHMLDRAHAALAQPIMWNATLLNAGASIGATILGRPHMRKPADLFLEADTALYAAKRAGRGVVRVFGEDRFDASPPQLLRAAVGMR